jgi:hypothetical protein
VLSSDIYMGALPWVVMQLILVAVVIFVPQSVTAFLDKAAVVDTDKVQLNFQVAPGRSEEPVEREDPSKLFGGGNTEAK